MIDYSESRRIIRQAILDNKLVIFVGAGASVQSGLPLWSKAVKTIYNKLGKTSVSEDEYLKIPQLYFNARGEKEYNELVKSIFKCDNKHPNELHKLIVQLNPCNVITTNYDNFLERSFWENGEFLEVIEHDKDIPYVKNSRMIIKMHGGFIRNNFVFKEDDYLNYSYNFPLIEIYIKALMAKNVIFFIGYSYNDPDIKQIFNWTKNILGNDFQRAYLLDVENSYDANNSNYYQNLGINILYALECSCKFKFIGGNFYQNAINFLKYIIEDEKESDVIDTLYEQLIPLNELNYILNKYIVKGLYKYNAVYINGSINLHDNNSKLIDFFKLLAAGDYKSEKLEVLGNIFQKSNTSKISIRKKNFDEFEELYLTSEKNIDSLFDNFDKQNLLELKNFAGSIDLYDDELDKQEILKVAFYFYELKEYTKCYYILKKISSLFKKEENYIWYFISEFNRKNVGQMFNSHRYNNSQIKEEYQKIDLERLLVNNFLKGEKQNKFLRELIDFGLMYTTLIDVLQNYDKIEKDTRTNFIGVTTPTTIEELEIKILDFYNYLKLNFLMIDIYKEVIEIYKSFINAVFCSHSKKEQDFTDGIFGVGRNVVLKELSSFMIIIICKYLRKKDISELIKKNNVKEVKLTKEAEDTLFEIFENYKSAFLNNILKNTDIDKIIRILTLTSNVMLSKEKFAQTLSIVNDLIRHGCFRHHNFNEISNFIVLHYKSNRPCIDENVLFETIEILFESIVRKRLDSDLYYLIALLKNSCFILHTLNEDLLLEDNIVENLIIDSRYLFLVPIYSIVDNVLKEKIRVTIGSYLLENAEFSFELYIDSVKEGIISPSEEFEDKMLSQLNMIIRQNSGVSKSFTDHKEQALDCCICLYLNDNLLDVSKFVDFFKNTDDKYNFLYDMDNFDYSKFDLSWIEHFNSNLKECISENTIAYNKIKSIYKEVFTSKEYAENMLNDYFKYFDKSK